MTKHLIVYYEPGSLCMEEKEIRANEYAKQVLELLRSEE